MGLLLLLGGLAAGLGGCGSLLGSSAMPTFDLTAPRDFPPHGGGGRGQLVVNEPGALAILDTDRIVVRPGDGQVAQLAGAQWSDRLPKLLQARIVQSFENANRLRAIGRPGDRISADYQLVIDVRSFNLTAASSATADVEISAKIVQDRTGRVLAARVFRASVPAASTEGVEAVRAIDAAFNRVAVELVLWASRVV